MDAEFIAQTLCLEHGWHEPNTLRALARARDTGALAAAAAAAELLLASFRQILRVECILRRWSFVGETVLPDHPAPLCGGENRRQRRGTTRKLVCQRPKLLRERVFAQLSFCVGGIGLHGPGKDSG